MIGLSGIAGPACTDGSFRLTFEWPRDLRPISPQPFYWIYLQQEESWSNITPWCITEQLLRDASGKKGDFRSRGGSVLAE